VLPFRARYAGVEAVRRDMAIGKPLKYVTWKVPPKNANSVFRASLDSVFSSREMKC
jgi:hypothetical protein